MFWHNFLLTLTSLSPPSDHSAFVCCPPPRLYSQVFRGSWWNVMSHVTGHKWCLSLLRGERLLLYMSCFALLFVVGVEERSLHRFLLWPFMDIYSHSVWCSCNVLGFSCLWSDYSDNVQSVHYSGLYQCVHIFSFLDFVSFVYVCVVFLAPATYTLTFTGSCHNWLLPTRLACSLARKKGLYFTEQTNLFKSSLI